MLSAFFLHTAAVAGASMLWYCVASFRVSDTPAPGSVGQGCVRLVDAGIGEVVLELPDGAVSVSLEVQNDSWMVALARVVSTGRHVGLEVHCEYEVRTARALVLHLWADGHRLVPVLEGGGRGGRSVPEEHLVLLLKHGRQGLPRRSPPRPPGEEGQASSHDNDDDRAAAPWLLERERRPNLTYHHRFPLLPDGRWFVDVGDDECLATDSGGGRTLHLRGGFLALPPRMRFPLLADLSTAPGPTLLLLSSLDDEAAWREHLTERQAPLWCTRARHLRAITLPMLRSASVVVTTVSLLTSSRAYASMVESALGGRPCTTRAALSAWARQPNHTEPILEAVEAESEEEPWTRILVDGSPLLRCHRLRLLSATTWWAMVAPEWLEAALDTRTPWHWMVGREERAATPTLRAALLKERVYQLPAADDRDLGVSSEEVCPICFDAPCDVHIVPCAHSFCGACLDRLQQQPSFACPLCRGRIRRIAVAPRPSCAPCHPAKETCLSSAV